MQIEPFVMERWQSTFEHHVDLNLSDSGVQPLRVDELLEPGEYEELLSQQLIYTQSNGTPELRDRIAALYPDASRANIEVTNGGSEANLISSWSLVEPDDEVIIQIPNYMQLWGVTKALGAVAAEDAAGADADHQAAGVARRHVELFDFDRVEPPLGAVHARRRRRRRVQPPRHPASAHWHPRARALHRSSCFASSSTSRSTQRRCRCCC